MSKIKIISKTLVALAPIIYCVSTLIGNKLDHKHTLAEEEDKQKRKKQQYANLDRFHQEGFASKGMNDIPDIESLRLFGTIIHEGDSGIIFGSPGQYKSVLAMQIAIDIAAHQKSQLFPDIESNHHPCTVHVFDAELSDVDIKDRYFKHGYKFPENLIRYTGTCKIEGLIHRLQDIVQQSSDNVVIILDNITKLCPGCVAAQINKLYMAMDNLKESAKEKHIFATFILIAHTNKENSGDRLKELEEQDLYGSSYATDFANFEIAIGPTHYDNFTKRIKAIKTRGEIKPENVIVAKVSNVPYRHLELVGLMSEQEAIGKVIITDDNKGEKEDPHISSELAHEMWAKYQRGVSGHGLLALAHEYGYSPTGVRNAFVREGLI